MKAELEAAKTEHGAGAEGLQKELTAAQAEVVQVKAQQEAMQHAAQKITQHSYFSTTTLIYGAPQLISNML